MRDVHDRVTAAAPFLKFDADPYPVIVNNRIMYVQDAYTTTSRYPYAQRANTDRLPGGSGLQTRFNYVRNSVKVVIDAYDGTMKFYVVDKADPIVKAYQKAFPKLFTVESRIASRKGRVYLDPFRNGFAQTVVAPYSVRRRPGAPYSKPLAWRDVKTGLTPGKFTLGSSVRE